jgi:hypothetical protein
LADIDDISSEESFTDNEVKEIAGMFRSNRETGIHATWKRIFRKKKIGYMFRLASVPMNIPASERSNIMASLQGRIEQLVELETLPERFISYADSLEQLEKESVEVGGDS